MQWMERSKDAEDEDDAGKAYLNISVSLAVTVS